MFKRCTLAGLTLFGCAFLFAGECQPEPPTTCGPDECGPPLGMPNTLCADGTVAGPGDCVRHADGSCGWEIITCPEPCTQAECGPAPGMPNTLCSDGTLGGPGDCYRNASGTCGWEIRTCPSYAFCGGFAARPCAEGFLCVDDQADNCDPAHGGADCGGICVDETTCAPPTCPDRG
ncbi:MAG: hypothetical protein ABIJ09_04310 [Pseudomonadota bacterium]